MEVLKHLERGKVVSSTRIEPHYILMPEKVLKDFGIEPEEFNELGLLQCVSELKSENKPITNGIFQVIYKDDFTSISVTTHFTHNQRKIRTYSIDLY